jgi:hypothetical protein
MKARPVDRIGTIVGVWLLLGWPQLRPSLGQTNPGTGGFDLDELGTRYARSIEEIVPPERREKLGLDNAGWTQEHGKVHPDVYKALEKAEKVRKRGWPDPVGFAGTVYVQVHLGYEQKGKRNSAENKAAIRQLQRKVLSQISAADFYVEYPFETLPGILGYVTRAGLEKLESHPDVVAVCLDQKPFPKRPPHVYAEDLPPLAPGDPSTQPAQGRFWGSGGKVEKEVYQVLGTQERVFVLVGLVHNPDRQEGGDRKQIGDRVLSVLTAEEFWLSSRTDHSLHGRVTRSGLQKLDEHPEVYHVRIPKFRFKVPEKRRERGGRIIFSP